MVVDRFGFIYVADSNNKRVQVFTSSGIFLRAIGMEFEPVDLALDPQLNLFVLMPEIKGIVKYSPEGKKLNKIPCFVNGYNYVENARGIAVDTKGEIYLTENLDSSVKKVDIDWNVLLSFGSEGEGRGQFDEPAGIACDSSGLIYIADSENKRVQVLSITGSTSKVIPPVLTSPPVVVFDSIIQAEKSLVDVLFAKGKGLYTLSDRNGHVLFIGPPNKIFGSPGEFDEPIALDVMIEQTPQDKVVRPAGIPLTGKIFVADTGNHRIQILNPDGIPEYQFGKKGEKPGQFDSPQGIAVNNRGLIYVADTRNHRIQIFNNDGIFLNTFGKESENEEDKRPPNGTFRYPKALSIDSKNKLYVLDYGNNRIQIFDEDGKFIRAIGRKGSQTGQFIKPADMAVDENDLLYVADGGNNRVQIFNHEGDFIMAFGAPAKEKGWFSNISGIINLVMNEEEDKNSEAKQLSFRKNSGYFEEISAITVSRGKIYVVDYETDRIQVFSFYPEGLTKEDRIVVTKTAYPPHNYAGADSEKYAIARKIAFTQAIRELADKVGMSEAQLKKKITIESEEMLANGQVKITVSVPKKRQVEKKAAAPVKEQIEADTSEEEFELQ